MRGTAFGMIGLSFNALKAISGIAPIMVVLCVHARGVKVRFRFCASGHLSPHHLFKLSEGLMCTREEI